MRPSTHQPAVAVRRVAAEADVGEEQELRKAGPQRPERLLDHAVLGPCSSGLVVLLLRHPEKQQRGNPGAGQLLGLAQQAVDGMPPQRGQLLVHERLGSDEDGHDEVVHGEPCLANEIP